MAAIQHTPPHPTPVRHARPHPAPIRHTQPSTAAVQQAPPPKPPAAPRSVGSVRLPRPRSLRPVPRPPPSGQHPMTASSRPGARPDRCGQALPALRSTHPARPGPRTDSVLLPHPGPIPRQRHPLPALPLPQHVQAPPHPCPTPVITLRRPRATSPLLHPAPVYRPPVPVTHGRCSPRRQSSHRSVRLPTRTGRGTAASTSPARRAGRSSPHEAARSCSRGRSAVGTSCPCCTTTVCAPPTNRPNPWSAPVPWSWPVRSSVSCSRDTRGAPPRRACTGACAGTAPTTSTRSCCSAHRGCACCLCRLPGRRGRP